MLIAYSKEDDVLPYLTQHLTLAGKTGLKIISEVKKTDIMIEL